MLNEFFYGSGPTPPGPGPFPEGDSILFDALKSQALKRTPTQQGNSNTFHIKHLDQKGQIFHRQSCFPFICWY